MQLNERMTQQVTQAKRLASMNLGKQPWVVKAQQATKDASDDDLGTIVAAYGLLAKAQEQIQSKQVSHLRAALDCATIVLAALLLIRHRQTVASILDAVATRAWDAYPLASGWAVMVVLAVLLATMAAISVIARGIRRVAKS